MQSQVKRLNQIVLGTLCTVGILATGTIVATAAWADYEPPSGPPPSGSSVSNGSRSEGCIQDEQSIGSTLLAPTQHVGQTTARHPTVMWYVSADAPYLSYLVLSEVTPSGPEPIYEMDQAQAWSQGGLGSFTLPKEVSPLEPGKRYLWSIAIACSLDIPTYGQAFETEFDVVALPAEVAATLTASAEQDTVDIYAENGYWYDAVWAAEMATGASGSREAIATLLNTLATSEDSDHGVVLRRIAQQLEP